MLATLKTNIAEVLSPVLDLDGAYIREAIVFSIKKDCFVFHLSKITQEYNESSIQKALLNLNLIEEISIQKGFVNIRVNDSFFALKKVVLEAETSFDKGAYLKFSSQFDENVLYDFYAFKQRLSILLKNLEAQGMLLLNDESRAFLVDVSYKLYRLEAVKNAADKLIKIGALKATFDQVYLYENFKNHSLVVFLAASLIYHQLMLFDKTLHTGL